ncbi:hypothetical protein DPMN_057932 [Dreissena polymorpha]|uniref:Uncharacterized protein n=1 Tax=Dreissena polymorpha TaxID=45954 RepID=A0A9D4C0T6_DREPO|nr:hypothetical protein DPMN_057932 [Dreissena polymorpha]
MFGNVGGFRIVPLLMWMRAVHMKKEWIWVIALTLNGAARDAEFLLQVCRVFRGLESTEVVLGGRRFT